MGSRGHKQICNLSCQKSAKATLTDRYKDYGLSTISMLTMKWPRHTILRWGNAKVSMENFGFRNHIKNSQPWQPTWSCRQIKSIFWLPAISFTISKEGIQAIIWSRFKVELIYGQSVEVEPLTFASFKFQPNQQCLYWKLGSLQTISWDSINIG